ncbi:MAG: hypothetical protein U9R42_00825 [Bacteroidota bacterium]|nr:hypothetical protein [Bacteroidota bacterium]
MKFKEIKISPHFVILILFSLYIFFPTNNSTIDAYGYAAGIKYGNELFNPHHLFYSATGYLLFNFLQWLGFSLDTLEVMKVLNASFATFSLLIFKNILEVNNINKKELTSWIIIAGTSFGFWRFATENETYIIPIAFSLLGSLYFLKSLKKHKTNFLLAGFFSALACLYHQIHFFWWFGLFIGILIYSKKIKNIFWYLLPVLIVFLSYALIIVFYNKQQLSFSNIIHFVFLEFFKGGVRTGSGLDNLLFTTINFIRTFFQAHGLMLFLFKKNILYILPTIVSIILIFFSIFQKNFLRLKKIKQQTLISKIFIFIFFLQLAFAFYSIGNSEFMVMLPFLAIIPLSIFFQFNKKSLQLIALSLLIWNFSYGILPNNFIDYSNNKVLISKILENQNSLFILKEDIQIQNEIYYKTGIEDIANVLKSPSETKIKNRSLIKLDNSIQDHLKNNKKVYTDCLNENNVINRACLIKNNTNKQFFIKYNLTAVDSFKTLFNSKYLFEIKNN